ncbi:MAG TPA: proton-conducting transporter membrane subunit [Armatimonadota bacterium]|jgi:hydrogenase-4 component B
MLDSNVWGGSALWGGAALCAWLAAAFVGLIAPRPRRHLAAIPCAVGCLLLAASAFAGGGQPEYLRLPLALGDAPFTLLFDPLSRWFLAIIGAVGLAAVVFSPGYLEHLRERVPVGFVWSAMALLLLSMAGVVLAANAIVFLVAWEAMALSSFALVATDHTQREIQRAALIYLGATRVGTAFLMAGFLWAHLLTGTWDFSGWNLHGAAALGPALLILVGLATKAGCWPFHLWLPIAHPAAPAPVSALMSGVMIKTAIYAMARLFVLDGHLAAPALGPILIALGTVSALWGVLFALLQHDLKRLLAYHSVENIGIILTAVGLAIVGRSWGLPALYQLGLAVALFHTLNHAVFKSLLFLGAGVVDARTHTRDIERLGGLIHRMPATAAAFIVGSAAICALPPLNGFASEWLLYQGFFQMARTGPTVGERLCALLLMGWLALIGGLAIACFVKAVGVTFLGSPRSRAAEKATEGTRGMVAAQIGLAFACGALGLGVPLLIAPLSCIVASPGEPSLLAAAWTLPTALLTLAMMGALAILTLAMARLARKNPARRFTTWDCGFGPLSARTQYTATSFAQPTLRLFGAVYRYSIAIEVGGRNRRYFPDSVDVRATHEPYLETRVYAPVLRSIERGAGAFLMRLQAGSIHQYLLHVALVLALLLWLGVRG